MATPLGGLLTCEYVSVVVHISMIKHVFRSVNRKMVIFGENSLFYYYNYNFLLMLAKLDVCGKMKPSTGDCRVTECRREI